MSLANIQGKLSRAEMKNIMAGSGSTPCTSDSDCAEKTITCSGIDRTAKGYCYANPGTTSKTCHWASC